MQLNDTSADMIRGFRPLSKAKIGQRSAGVPAPAFAQGDRLIAPRCLQDHRFGSGTWERSADATVLSRGSN